MFYRSLNVPTEFCASDNSSAEITEIEEAKQQQVDMRFVRNVQGTFHSPWQERN